MNMIQSAKDQVLALTTAAYQKAAAAGLLPEGVTVTPSVEIPKDTANGDYTTTFCLAAAKAMKMNPRQVAQILTEQMDLADTYFTSVELAGPGFLNFRLGSRWFGDTVACVEAEGADYGRNDTLAGKKYMVEFVSATPRPHAHGQRPWRRAGRHAGLRAPEVRCRRVAGVLRQRCRQPDR